MLEPRQCEVELWADRFRGAAQGLVHLGGGCRLGGLEWATSLDRATARGESTIVAAGVQAKWARPVFESVSAGWVLAASYQATAPRGVTGGSALIPVTWQAADTLMLHANVGRDFRRGGADTNRGGAAIQWSPMADWSFVAERYQESSAQFWRAAARYTIMPDVTIDLGRATQLRGGDGASQTWWTLGVNWALKR